MIDAMHQPRGWHRERRATIRSPAGVIRRAVGAWSLTGRSATITAVGRGRGHDALAPLSYQGSIVMVIPVTVAITVIRKPDLIGFSFLLGCPLLSWPTRGHLADDQLWPLSTAGSKHVGRRAKRGITASGAE